MPIKTKSKSKVKTTTEEKPVVKKVCFYCESEKVPSYKDPESLRKFVSSRARISSRKRSGLCAKHQRQFTVAVKRARHLGLLPFKISV